MSALIRWIPDGHTVVAQQLAIHEAGNMTVAGYQDAAAAQICSNVEADGSPDTISGLPPEAYMFLGVREEYAETLEQDKVYGYYNRAAALLVQPGETYANAKPAPVNLHRKEFGDLSWYVANTLNYYDISLADAIGVADTTTLAELDTKALEHAAQDPAIFQKPGVHFLTAADSFVGAIEQMLRRESNIAAVQMFRSAGQLMVAQSVLLQLRLDAGLAAVLPDNIRKVERRIREGNVYDPAGGDAR